MAYQKRVVSTALTCALCALTLAANVASAHGDETTSVVQRYDEHFLVGSVAFVVVLGVTIVAWWRIDRRVDQPRGGRPRPRVPQSHAGSRTRSHGQVS